MRIKVESDGTLRNTVVKNAETGEPIDGIVRVEILIDANKPESPRLKLWLTDVDLEMIGDITETRPPMPGLTNKQNKPKTNPKQTPRTGARFVRANGVLF
jgi:hypothetical protein